MRAIAIVTLFLFCSCAHEKVVEPVVSRPPPFWPPHEFTGPPVQGPMITIDEAVILRELLRTEQLTNL